MVAEWQTEKTTDQKISQVGGRVAETERELSKILKSGGRAADGKDQKILQVGGVADGRV